MNTDSQWSKRMACFHVRLRCGLLSNITLVSHLANDFDVQSVLQARVAGASELGSCQTTLCNS